MLDTRPASKLASFVLLLVCALASGVYPDPISAAARTWHVAPTGADTAGCGEASAPCRTIQRAVDAASNDDTILVGAGNYGYTSAADTCAASQRTSAVVCIVDKRLTILGGFSPADWTTANPANQTIVDGGGSVRGVYVRTTTFDAVVGLRLEDITLQNGRASGIPGGDKRDALDAYGGGLFFDNRLGSPGSLSDELLTLRRIAFKNNIAQGETLTQTVGGRAFGGGMALLSLTPLRTLEQLSFEGNQAIGGSGAQVGGYAAGGGLFVERVKIDAGTHLTFTNNLARGGETAGSGFDNQTGARADAYGGGAAILTGSSVQLQYVVASGNAATGGNASTYAGGALGGAFKVQDATLLLRDATLSQNMARGGSATNGWLAGGGAIEAVDSSLIVERSTVVANQVIASAGVTQAAGLACGGGVMAWHGFYDMVVQISNTIVADNTIEQGLGSSVPSVGGGGGMCLGGALSSLAHLTLAHNRLSAAQPALQGVALLLRDGSTAAKGSASMAYSIVADQAGDAGAAAVHVQPGHTLDLNRGLYVGNTKNDNSDNLPASSGVYSGTATMLNAVSAGFVAPGDPGFNYHLTAASPARDQASGSWLTDDVDGDTRPDGPTADIGADEFRSTRKLYLPLVAR